MGTIMKKLGVCIAALATTALTCGFAHGADMTLAPAHQAPVIPAVPVYTWTGIYFGVNGGYGFGQSTPMSLFSDSFSAFNYNANG
jgi:outer membrane immunogenic protein